MQSVPQQIRTRVLNMTIGQWMRAVDLVMDEYSPRNNTVEAEADYVAKLAVLVMLQRWYDENDICLLLDSSALRLPKRLAESSRYQITRILDRPPSGEGVIESFEPHDDDAPPGDTDPEGTISRLPADDPLP
jgi:hypothetical protein